MPPVGQGMYEFRKESLTEVRKRMGVSQSKMAELLGIPANTLSRWETGATVPDAAALAAIYSLAKDHGVDVPPFFGLRTTPPELRLASKPPEQPEDSLAFLKLLKSYLHTTIELAGTELAPVVKVEIRNMAPVSRDLPQQVVFTGVGLSVAHLGQEDIGLSRMVYHNRMRTRREPAQQPDETAGTPWQHDSKRLLLLEAKYRRVDQKEFPDITPNERDHGEVLFPGQAIEYEMDVTSELLPYLQFRTEGTVSRRHLFHCSETFPMPQGFTKPLAIRAFIDYANLGVEVPINGVLKLLPEFDKDPRLEEVQVFSKALIDNLAKSKTIQEKLNQVFREHKLAWFRAHLRATYVHLDRVNTAFERMKEAVDSSDPDRIAAEALALVALKGEGTQLDHETEELMRSFNISAEEIRRV